MVQITINALALLLAGALGYTIAGIWVEDNWHGHQNNAQTITTVFAWPVEFINAPNSQPIDTDGGNDTQIHDPQTPANTDLQQQTPTRQAAPNTDNNTNTSDKNNTAVNHQNNDVYAYYAHHSNTLKLTGNTFPVKDSIIKRGDYGNDYEFTHDSEENTWTLYHNTRRDSSDEVIREVKANIPGDVNELTDEQRFNEISKNM